MDMVVAKIRLLATIERFGYHVAPMERRRPVDIRTSQEHPLSAAYRYPGRRLLIEAPVSLGFGLFHYPLERPPLLADVIPHAFRARDQAHELIRERLSAFYSDWQPSSAAAYLGLTDEEAPTLAGIFPWASVWPWDPMDIDRKQYSQKEVIARENFCILGKNLPIESGWQFCGPVTEEKLDVEVKRLVNLINSIHDRGFQRRDGVDGDINIAILCQPDGEWRWQVLCGHHRFIVMSALMGETITARVMQFVRREEVEHWPGVVKGTFSIESALKIFDRCFELLPRSNI